MRSQTVDLPPLSLRADVGTVNEDRRTVELVFSTGAAAPRMDYWSGKRYLEILQISPRAVRLERLNAGAPLLNAHMAYSVANMLGTVEAGTARIEKGQALATVRFSKRADVEPIWQDVRDRIVRSVSVGYRVHKFEETAGDGQMPTRTAVDWEPFEVSLVPMPLDMGAKVRHGDRSETNRCLIVPAAALADADRRRQLQLVRARH